MRLAPWAFAVGVRILKVPACPSFDDCEAPFGCIHTTSLNASDARPAGCCASMPPLPLLSHNRVVAGATVQADAGSCAPRVLESTYKVQYPGYSQYNLTCGDDVDPPVCPDAGLWRELLAELNGGLSTCARLDPFYTQYANAFSDPVPPGFGIPVIGGAKAPPAAVVKARDTIAEMIRQTTVQLAKACPTCRNFAETMASHYARFAVWADGERKFDNCEKCVKHTCGSKESEGWLPDSCCASSRLFPDAGLAVGSLNCADPEFFRRSMEYKLCYEGKDTSEHPGIPWCVEGGGPGVDEPTAFTEELGLCYLEDDGEVSRGYQGRHIILEEWFHTMHGVGIMTADPEGYRMIHENAMRLNASKVWMANSTKGHALDKYGSNEYEFMAMAIQVWHGFPEDVGYFAYQSRAEIKQMDPQLTMLISRFFEDSRWNPCAGIKIDAPRPQTNACNKGFFGVNPNDKRGGLWVAGDPVVQAPGGCTNPCESFPGSALCGGSYLGEGYVGPPVEELLKDPAWRLKALGGRGAVERELDGARARAATLERELEGARSRAAMLERELEGAWARAAEFEQQSPIRSQYV